jgi:uncharacterized protein YbjT (DUF2867 family)
MKVLLTGANGYVGRRLLTKLLEAGHHVTCLVRDKRRFRKDDYAAITDDGLQLEIIQGDLLDRTSLRSIPARIEAAYYLVHSMGSDGVDFPQLEARSAENFVEALSATDVRQIIYLSGIINEPADNLSPHLASRLNVEKVLNKADAAVTVLRAAIIVGSGSASFEIMRDLVEKLPLMVAPKWLRTRCQPIAISDVLAYLTGVLGNDAAAGETFDIGGPEVLTYQDLLMRYAAVRGLRRIIIPVPLLTPRLSSYWLYFVTSTSFPLARSLVDSLTHDMACSENRIQKIVSIDLLNYDEAVERALSLITQNQVPSSWFDAVASGRMDAQFLDNVETPTYGVFKDERKVAFNRDPAEVRENIWRIGGNHGWYTMNWAWRLRGWLDRLAGGTGLRRGRRHHRDLRAGDALDFWRVLVADEEQSRLILFAEMKLPGEAWLEFHIEKTENCVAGEPPWILRQTATFRPRGLLGRLYWISAFPLHLFVFGGMARAITTYKTTGPGSLPSKPSEELLS